MLNQRKYTQILLARQVKRICCAWIISLILQESELCSMEHNGRGTKAIGMANAFVAVSDNCWAIDYNPAGLTRLTAFQCAAFIVPSQFGLQELRTTAFAAASPLTPVTMGIQVVKFGFDLYSETECGLACAVPIDKNISSGLNFNYQRLALARYGSAGSFSLDGGLIAHVLDRVDVGFSIHNMTNAVLGKTDETMPQWCALGTCWSAFHDLQISVEVEKDIRFPASIKMGIEQLVFTAFALRAGMANNPDKYSIGIGATYSSFEFGYAGYSHPDLGWTHQIDLTFTLNKNN